MLLGYFFMSLQNNFFRKEVRKDPYFAYRNGLMCLGRGCGTYSLYIKKCQKEVRGIALAF